MIFVLNNQLFFGRDLLTEPEEEDASSRLEMMQAHVDELLAL